MNPLDSHPTTRKAVYAVFWVLSLAVGGTQVGYAAADVANPTWLTVALSVVPFVGGYIGYTAMQNTPARIRQRLRHEDVPHVPHEG